MAATFFAFFVDYVVKCVLADIAIVSIERTKVLLVYLRIVIGLFYVASFSIIGVVYSGVPPGLLWITLVGFAACLCILVLTTMLYLNKVKIL